MCENPAYAWTGVSLIVARIVVLVGIGKEYLQLNGDTLWLEILKLEILKM